VLPRCGEINEQKRFRAENTESKRKEAERTEGRWQVGESETSRLNSERQEQVETQAEAWPEELTRDNL